MRIDTSLKAHFSSTIAVSPSKPENFFEEIILNRNLTVKVYETRTIDKRARFAERFSVRLEITSLGNIQYFQESRDYSIVSYKERKEVLLEFSKYIYSKRQEEIAATGTKREPCFLIYARIGIVRECNDFLRLQISDDCQQLDICESSETRKNRYTI